MTLPAKDDGIPGTITETSLVLRPGLTYKQWEKVGIQLGLMQRGVMFWVADWMEHGETAYGEKFTQALEMTGYSPQTLLNIAWVGRAVPRSRRRDDLSFGHHACVAGLEPKEQAAWLKRAAEGDGGTRWSEKRFREELRARSNGSAGPASAPPAATTSTSTVEPAPAAGRVLICPCGRRHLIQC